MISNLRNTMGIPPRIAFFPSKSEFLLKVYLKIKKKENFYFSKNGHLKNNTSSPLDIHEVIVDPYK